MKLLCATILSIMAVVSAVKYLDCGSADCKIDSVDVSNCAADATMCDFTKGTNVSMTVKFTTTKDNVTDLEDDIAGQVAGQWVPFKTTNVCDAIQQQQQKCPLSSGVTVTYVLSLYISKVYPTITVPVKSNMTDTVNGNPGVCICFEIEGKIV